MNTVSPLNGPSDRNNFPRVDAAIGPRGHAIAVLSFMARRCGRFAIPRIVSLALVAVLMCSGVFFAVGIAGDPHAQARPEPGTMPYPQGVPPILVGVSWYPEQWPESRWEEDLRLMEAADLKVVRVAEFSWSRMEPSEGRYDFDWLERAVNLAAKHHIMSVLDVYKRQGLDLLRRAGPQSALRPRRCTGKALSLIHI